MGRYRMVTLDGDLVEKSGAMTGGHYRSRMKFAAGMFRAWLCSASA
jgi:chromosome segregation protein